MTDSHHPTSPPDVLDGLVAELLSCGGVLSQIIASMVEFEASGRGHPDAAPIPEVAHTLIRSVLEDLETRFSKRDVRVATRLVHEVTEKMCSEIYTLGPELD